MPETLPPADREQASKIVAAVQGYLPYVGAVVDHVQIFFADEIKPENEEAAAVLKEEQVPQVVELFAAKVKGAEELETGSVKKLLKETSKELKLKGRQVFMPIRVALTGQMHGPELHDIIPILGKEKVLQRLSQTTGLSLS